MQRRLQANHSPSRVILIMNVVAVADSISFYVFWFRYGFFCLFIFFSLLLILISISCLCFDFCLCVCVLGFWFLGTVWCFRVWNAVFANFQNVAAIGVFAIFWISIPKIVSSSSSSSSYFFFLVWVDVVELVQWICCSSLMLWS